MSYFKINVWLTKRGFSVLFIPYLTISTWYYLFYARMLGHVLEHLGATPQTSLVNALFHLLVVFSMLVGSFFVDKIDKLRIIYMWAAIMPIPTILLLFTSNPAAILVLLFLLGALFGICSLAYCAYFCSLTNTDERGRVGGVIIFISLVSNPLFLLLSVDFLSILIAFIFLGLSTFTIHLLKPRKKASLTTKEKLSKFQSDNGRSFLFYLIPWLIFCAINGTSAEIVTRHLILQFGEVAFQAQALKYLAAGVSALAGGVLADWVGRRVALSIGVASYGMGAAFSGIATTPGVCILSAFVSGFGWGTLIVLYTLVVWGDLTSRKMCAPFYAAGFIPFYFSKVMVYLGLPEILHISAMYAALVSSFLIFLSIVPIIFAKELLPEYIIEEMNLKFYIDWIKKFSKKQKASESKKFKRKGRKPSQEKDRQEE